MPPDPPPPAKKSVPYSALYLVAALLALWAMQRFVLEGTPPRSVRYDELLQLVRDDKVAKIVIGESRLQAELKPDPAKPKDTPPERVFATRLPEIDETPLVRDLVRNKAEIVGQIEQATWWSSLLIGWILPMAVLVGLYWLFLRRVGKQAGAGPMSFGKSKAKIYDLNEGERVTFDDVAGVDEAEAELIEVVSFLKEPQKYTALGARIPKGVLLVGPPGTGKTLLARAVAGEAAVPFFQMTGSEFVEMFVGVGAARMRDLFEQAKQRAPCIVFVDEIDAIGKSRGGVGAMATHDEREQTLNQLLAEMDGFDPQKGVVIMAATNRPEVLDQALLRAGRFDRQVLVDRPDVAGRLAILKVHARKVKLDPDLELEAVARRVPGMVGADLANVVNEAALAAARRGGDRVERQDFEEAIDRIQLGLKKKGRMMNEDEKRRVAWHEAGHALVALSVAHADPVHRVTIIPRSIGALGATLQLPTEDRYLLTRDELRDRLAVMMGGRAAELVALGSVSTGAENDLERATETARQMVCRFGMSQRLGPATFGRASRLRFLETPVGLPDERNFSEETARAIDSELREVLDEASERARSCLEERRAALDRIAGALLEHETLERADLDVLLQEPG